MIVNSFDKRIRPHKMMGVPDPVFFLLPVAGMLTLFVFIVPVLPIKIVSLICAPVVYYFCFYVWKNYDDWLINTSLLNGKQLMKAPSFAALNKKSYTDYFTWETFIDENIIKHDDGSISLAFIWGGVHDRFFEGSEFEKEHNRRASFLKNLPTDIGLCVENHFLRINDDSMVDEYIKTGHKMHNGKTIPPIVKDIREQVANLYRPYCRTNRVMTVLSIGTQKRTSLFDYFLPNTYNGARNASALIDSLRELLDNFEHEYRGFRLLTYEEYRENIQLIYKPNLPKHMVDWRFNLAEQLIDEKPGIDKDCLKIGDTFYYCCLVQNYPSMNYGWTLNFCEAPVNVHVSQIYIPKSTDAAIDKNKKQALYENTTISERKGTDNALNKLKDSGLYRAYVTQNSLAIADNAYIITFFGNNKDAIKKQVKMLSSNILSNEGLLRFNVDLQMELFKTRLPGIGRTSSFMREDHADTIAIMSPVTTFPEGNRNPESIRLSSSSQLIGYTPSRTEVPHELVAAETGGGKDTQFGLKFLETYPLIRYDFIELGNSYQGVVEAVGGKYCRAKEQVINPLSAYEDYQSAINLTKEGAGHLDVDFIRTQSDLLTPILKGGMNAGRYSKAEEAVVNRVIKNCYDQPNNKSAPTLPIILDLINTVECNSDKQREAQESLGSELYEFLESATGTRFKDEDQFTISSVANAIDFDKFTGELFEYYMMFITIRLATSAMTRGARSQIVLNEYKVLYERAPEPIKWITLTIDRMGRKDWVGLTRITQGISEIKAIDPESINSIPNKTLLSRVDEHRKLGGVLKLPDPIISHWENFKTPELMNKLGYREGLVCESGQWHKLFLKFPQLLLDIMNTRGEDKPLRDQAYREEKDPYKRIHLFNKLIKERDSHV